MGLGFILTISVIALVVIGGYAITQQKTLKEKISQKESLYKEVEHLLNLKTSLDNAIEDCQNQLAQQKDEYYRKILELNQEADRRKYDLDLKYQSASKTIQDNIQAEESKYETFKKEKNAEYLEIENKLSEIKTRLDAQIEAEKREQQLLEQQDFYKMSFPKDEIKDIEYLYFIADNLKNPQILYKLIWTEYVQDKFKKLWSRIGFKEKTSGIYKITNLSNKKVYIGQSVDLQSRLQNHIKAGLGIDTVAHQKIHEAMRSEGLQNFTFEILKTCPKEQLNDYEKDFISTYHSNEYGYNVTGGGS